MNKLLQINGVDASITPSAEFRYFLFDPEDHEFIYFRSAADRDAAAPDSIQRYCEDGWDETVTRIVAGELTHTCQKTNVVPRPPEDEIDEEGCDSEGRYWQESWSYYCDYELLPIAAK